jgi:SAM-dependent methyltransferase
MPCLSEDQLSEYYPATFEAYSKASLPIRVLKRVKYASDIGSILSEIKQGLKTHPTFFEIGAGKGDFLSYTRARGFEVSGLEPSEHGVSYAAKEYGLKMFRGYLSDYLKGRHQEKAYDVVLARHVIEHMNDANESVRQIREKLLKPGGLLVLKLPRLDSWEFGLFGATWHGLDLPRHRFHFTRAGIEKLLTSVGYSAVKVKNEFVPLDIARSVVNRRLGSRVGAEAKQNPKLPFSASGAGRMIVFARS